MKATKYWFSIALVIGMVLGGCKESQNPTNDAAIHIAAMYGNLDEIESMLAENPALVNAKDDDGDTPLHLAVTMFGKHEAVKLLLAKGADINAKGRESATPLHLALTKLGDKEMAKLLIANGADVNAKDALMGATPLHFAVDEGHEDVIELLISKGADIDATNQIGGTALHVLTQEGQEDNTDMVAFLLSKGANINAKDNAVGGTPLHYAAMNGYKNIVEFLIANGADVNSRGNNGETPLTLAAMEGHGEVVELLRKHVKKDITDLLNSIEESGLDDKGVLVFTERLKDISPEMNKNLGNILKQDYTDEWCVGIMLAIKMSEQQFKALGMNDDADEANRAVESLEIAWSQGDGHEILKMSFYATEADIVLTNITENMSEEQQKQLSVDTRPVKALAKRLTEQAQKKK